MNLDKNIQAHRKRLNISQEDLGKMLFVSRQTVSMWENGQTQPTLDNLVRLGEIFSVSVDELLNGEQKEREGTEGSAPSDEETYRFQFSLEELKEIGNYQLWKIYRFAFFMTAIMIYSILCNLLSQEDSAALDLFLGISIIFEIVVIALVVFSVKTWKRSEKRALETVYQYRLYAEHFELDTYVAGERGNCYKYKYADVKVMDEFKNYLLFQVEQRVFMLRRSEMKQDSFLFGYIFKNPDQIKKLKKKEKWQKISIALFVASIVSVYLSMLLVALVMEITGAPPESMPKKMWIFFTLTPIPLSSVVYGIVQQSKGRKCKKNIIGGLIVFFVLCIYGSFAFLF